MKEKKFDVLILFQISLLILGLLLGMYMKRTENYNLLPLQHILLSIMLFIMGYVSISELRGYYGLSE